MKPEKVLIIDDQESILRALEPMVRRLGYDVSSDTDARRAIDMAEASTPAVLLTDFVMPTMDGLEVARAIIGQGRGTQVVVMTGRIEPIKAIDAYQAGASDYIHKPITDEDELRDVLRRACRRFQRWRKIVFAATSRREPGNAPD